MLERISGLTQEQAKDQLLSTLEEELDTEKSKRILEHEFSCGFIKHFFNACRMNASVLNKSFKSEPCNFAPYRVK